MHDFFSHFRRLNDKELKSLATLSGGMAALVLAAMFISGQLPFSTQGGSIALKHIDEALNTGGPQNAASIFFSTNPIATYSTPGTYTFTVPAGVTAIEVTVVGGGGGSGGDWFCGDGGPGAGGGSGGATNAVYQVAPGQQFTVVVGAGGAGGRFWEQESGCIGSPATQTPGSPGGNSSFGSTVATGGGAGSGASNPNVCGGGGAGGSPNGGRGGNGCWYSCGPISGGSNGTAYGAGGTNPAPGPDSNTQCGAGGSGGNGFVSVSDSSFFIDANPDSIRPGDTSDLTWSFVSAEQYSCTVKDQSGNILAQPQTQTISSSQTLTVPSFSTMQVTALGGGGGGGSGGSLNWDLNGNAGGAGGLTKFDVITANGGGGGGGGSWTGSTGSAGAAGTASGGDTNTTGGGASGGVGGSGDSVAQTCDKSGCSGGGNGGSGGAGGKGGKTIKTYTSGQLPGTVSVTVGSGGAAGAAIVKFSRTYGTAGSSGSKGSVTLLYDPPLEKTVSPTNTTTYTITCTGGGVNISTSTTITVSNTPILTITGNGNPDDFTVPVGTPVTIAATYTAAQGDAITASAINDFNNQLWCGSGNTCSQTMWTQSPVTSKSYTFTPTTAGSYVFYPAAESTLYPSWNNYGESLTITAVAACQNGQGTENNCTSCNAGYVLSGGQCVPQCPHGQGPVGACTSCDDGYTLSGGQCIPPPAGTITGPISADPSRVRAGDATSLSWSTTDMTSCSLKDDSGNTLSTALNSAGTPTSAIGHQTTYTLSCTDGTNNYTSSVTVKLVPQIKEI